jgi:hypothetical protein
MPSASYFCLTFSPLVFISEKKIKGGLWDHLVVCVSPPLLIPENPVQSSKLLLALASTVVLGLEPHQDPWSYLFFSFQTFTCFEMRRPLQWDYYRSLPFSWGVILLALTLTHPEIVLFISSDRTAKKTPPPTVPLLLSYFPCVCIVIYVVMLRQILLKLPLVSNFMKIYLVVVELFHAYRRTDRREI